MLNLTKLQYAMLVSFLIAKLHGIAAVILLLGASTGDKYMRSLSGWALAGSIVFIFITLGLAAIGNKQEIDDNSRQQYTS